MVQNNKNELQQTEEVAKPEEKEVRSESKQRDQAVTDLNGGVLNKQQQENQSEQFKTGRTKVTGVGKNLDGSGGLPSGESIFGDARNQNALRESWMGKNQRKEELLQEIMEANAQGKLVGDGGFVATAITEPQALKPDEKLEENEAAKIDTQIQANERIRIALASAFPSAYGRSTEHLPIPVRPEHAANSLPGQKPDDSDKNGGDKQPEGSIVGGGAPPPGDDETRRLWSDPNFDPDHGTLWEFVKKHTYVPEKKDPKAPAEKHEHKDKEEEKQREKEKEKSQPDSGFSSDIYRTADGKLLSPAEVARGLNLNTRTDLLKKLTTEDLQRLGLERIPKDKVDATVAAHLESIVEKTAVIENGRVTPESGLKTCELIRKSLETFCPDINTRNLAFLIERHEGKTRAHVSINGRDAIVPGTMPVVPDTNTLFNYEDVGRPVNNHSEPKLLESVAPKISEQKNKTELFMFTEQLPCAPHCKELVQSQFPQHFKEEQATLSVTGVYAKESDRLKGVQERMRKYKGGKQQ